ncbi:MAG TPA: DNA-protecting protein DprA [Acidimicrobiales bacterium]|jgi:DNA processing protein|nr:DNA-protecting protein DprA [Acidimicrobiales bacterium]
MTSELPDEAYATALSQLPKMGPAKLRELLSQASPEAVWKGITEPSSSAREEVAKLWWRYCDLGINVVLQSHPNYPKRLLGWPHAPAVLFCRGNSAVLNDRPTVAVVGTRSPTRYGIGVSAQLGAELSATGVSVISGLALGIDGAAHEGACGAGAPPIAVLAGGVGEPYPVRHRRLWERVSELGTVVSETPEGMKLEKWRFAVRNRLMAALSDVVVVVESRHQGGSRHTVDAAMYLSKPVGAVPGSIRSLASEGTNALMSEGAFPVCSVTDVLVALFREGADVTLPKKRKSKGEPPKPKTASEEALYDILTFDPVSLDELVRLTGVDFPALCGDLERLAQAGLVQDLGGYWQRI